MTEKDKMILESHIRFIFKKVIEYKILQKKDRTSIRNNKEKAEVKLIMLKIMDINKKEIIRKIRAIIKIILRNQGKLNSGNVFFFFFF